MGIATGRRSRDDRTASAWHLKLGGTGCRGDSRPPGVAAGSKVGMVFRHADMPCLLLRQCRMMLAFGRALTNTWLGASPARAPEIADMRVADGGQRPFIDIAIAD